MNKSIKLDIMRIRAKMKIEKLVKQHEIAWRGESPKEKVDANS